MSDKKALVALAKEASIQDSVTKVFDLMGGVTCLVYTSDAADEL